MPCEGAHPHFIPLSLLNASGDFSFASAWGARSAGCQEALAQSQAQPRLWARKKDDKAGPSAQGFAMVVTLATVSTRGLATAWGHTEAKIWGLFVWEPEIRGGTARILTLAGTMG